MFANGIVGCGKKDTQEDVISSEEDKNENTETNLSVDKTFPENLNEDKSDKQTELVDSSDKQYREFDVDDFINIDRDEREKSFTTNMQKPQNQDVSEFVGYAVDKCAFSNGISEQESCVNIINLGCVGEPYYYYKVEVTDIDTFKGNMSKMGFNTDGWSANDEIYMLCSCYYAYEPTVIYMYLRNYSVPVPAITTPVSKLTDMSDSTEIATTNSIIYSIQIPRSWIDACVIKSVNNRLEVYMKSNNEAGKALLFSIDVFEPDNTYLEDVNQIGKINLNGNIYVLAWEYSGDRQCSDKETEPYFAMQDMAEQIVKTIQLNHGYCEWGDGVPSDIVDDYILSGIDGEYANDEYIIMIYEGTNNDIEVEVEGITVGTAVIVSNTGDTYIYESDTGDISIEYNRTEDSIFINALPEIEGENCTGTYERY